MSTKDKWILPLAILVGLVLQGFVLGWSLGPGTDGVGAVVTGPNIENYIPAIQQNRGYKSALPIETTGAAEFASTTVETGLSIGNLGTQLSRVNAGTCTIRTTNGQLTFTASTTQQVSCQGGSGTQSTALTLLPAYAAGDAVFVQPPTTTPITGLSGGLDVLGARASNTAGYITLTIFNGTGASFTWGADASSSWSWLFMRP